MSIDLTSRGIRVRNANEENKMDVENAEVFMRERIYKISKSQVMTELSQTLEETDKGNVILRIPQTRNGSNDLPDIDRSSMKPCNTTQRTYKVGDFIAKRLEELGVRHYFTVPGDSNLSLLDCLLENTHMRMVPCCNELNAGYAADGYARTSNAQVAVAVIPYIVGGLSILNAVCGAHAAGLKVIVISGCPNTAMLAEDQYLHHTPSPGNRDQALHAFKGVTAAAVRVNSAANATGIIDRTILSCLDNSLPVYIEVPNDIATAPCSIPGPISHTPELITSGQRLDNACRDILDILDQSKFPSLIIGRSARQFLSRHEIRCLAEKLACPVFCQPDGRWFSESHPQYCGIYWPGFSNQATNETVQKSDLWVVIGGCWSDIHSSVTNINMDQCRMISLRRNGVDLLDRERIESVDPRAIVKTLVSSGLKPKTGLFDCHESIHASFLDTQITMTDTPLKMERLVAGVQAALCEHDTLIADAGDTWFASTLVDLPPRADCLMQLDYSSIGWAMPATLGSQLARSEGRVVLLTGDGALQMTVQEMSTLIRMKLNPIIFVFNNLGYKVETAIQDGPYNYIANWDYTKVVSAFIGEPHVMPYNPYAPDEGATSTPPIFTMQVKTERDLVLALEKAKAEPDKLAFLECCIHPEDMTPGLRRLGNAVSEKLLAPASDSGYATSDCGDGRHLGVEEKERPDGALRASNLVKHLTSSPKVVPAWDSPDILGHKVCTDHMVQVRWSLDKGWDTPELVPYGPIALMPNANVLHYATSCFEGLKAYRGQDGKLRLFRPEYNCERMLDSADRVRLPTFDPAELLKLLCAILEIDAPKWLPKNMPGYSLYIRPTLIGSDAGLSVKEPTEAILYIILSCWPTPLPAPELQVSPKNGLHLLCSPHDDTRAWPNGSGAAKVSANYGPSLVAHTAASKEGFDQVLWLFGPERVVTEAGTSNFILIWVTKYGKLELVTPSLENGTILPGLTRRSVLELARERLTTGPIIHNKPDGSWRFLEPLDVVERDFTMREVAIAENERRLRGAFVVGTACGISPVSRIQWDEQEIWFPEDFSPYFLLLRKWYFDIVSGEEDNGWARVVEG